MAKRLQRYRSLAQFMELRGYNQKDLAALLGISRPYFCKILKGTRRASVDLVFKLSQISGVPMEVLSVELHGKRVA